MKLFRPNLHYLRHGKPGRRFRETHRRTAENQVEQRSTRRLIQGVLGLGLILIGFFFMAVPGPGIPIVLLGLLLLATISSRAARLLDRGEIFMRLAWGGALTTWQTASQLQRGLLAAGHRHLCHHRTGNPAGVCLKKPELAVRQKGGQIRVEARGVGQGPGKGPGGPGLVVDERH